MNLRVGLRPTATQNWMNQMADWHQLEDRFEEGEQVYLKLQPYRQGSICKQVYHQLSSGYVGHL